VNQSTGPKYSCRRDTTDTYVLDGLSVWPGTKGAKVTSSVQLKHPYRQLKQQALIEMDQFEPEHYMEQALV
jgi:hypothetical protein